MRTLVFALTTVGVLAFAAPAIAHTNSSPAAAQSGATDFSSVTVVVRDGHRHRHWRHRYHGCRTAVTSRWHHGRRIVKRTRVCR
jgi:hypothetical protein